MDRCKDKVCPPGKICNPASKRCVFSRGKVGKKIRAASPARKRSKSPRSRRSSEVKSKCAGKVCPSDPKEKVCNPSTGRCVLKDGKVGKKFSRRSRSRARAARPSRAVLAARARVPKVPKLKAARVFNTPYGKEIRKMLPAGVTEFSKLGRGTFGVVYLSCVDSKNPKTCSVFKVERIPKNYEDMKDVEPAMQRKFANHGLAPKVRNVRFTRNNKGSLYRIIEMEKIAGTLASYLKIKRPLRVLEMIAEWVSDLIESMCKYGLIHGDMHLDNIGYNLLEDKMFYGKAYPVAMNLQLIDFGWACCANKAVPCNPRMELLQLARTADIGIEQSNGDHLRDMFLEMYNERYRPHVSGDQKSLEKAYEKLFYAYEEDVYDKQHV